MNKLVVCTAAFSLALLACVEDPVSSALPATGNGESSAVAESSSETVPASSETVATSSTPASESSAAKPASSASVESSSATAPASSESVTQQSIPFLATCVNDVVYVEDSLSISSDVAPPSAYKFYTPAGIPVLTLKGSYFDIPCDKKQAESFMFGLNFGDKSVASFACLVSGDTLYARVSRSKGFSYGCSCAAEVSFGFEEGGTYIQYVSFEHNEVIPAPELHYIVASSSDEDDATM